MRSASRSPRPRGWSRFYPKPLLVVAMTVEAGTPGIEPGRREAAHCRWRPAWSTSARRRFRSTRSYLGAQWRRILLAVPAVASWRALDRDERARHQRRSRSATTHDDAVDDHAA
ncbi:MAG: hypothetical protein ACLSHJ_05785 [Oscillospiraceae bacterium]